MTIMEIVRNGQMCSEVFKVYQHSAVAIAFTTKDGKKDETELIVHQNLLTKDGVEELRELWAYMSQEFKATENSVLSVTIVGSVPTYEKLKNRGY